MVLFNKEHSVAVTTAQFYENCIKSIDVENVIRYTNNIILLLAWLPTILSIDISTDETVIRFKDEKDEINIGFTGYEWIFNDYINSFYVKE